MPPWIDGPRPVAGVLFDLDGTLLDSAPDLVGTLNWLRGGDGLPPLEVAAMARFASRGAVGLINAGFPARDERELESRRLQFIDHYAANSYRYSRLFDGVEELLAFLDRSAIPWGIVTNKLESLTLPILQASGLARGVSAVVCGDTASRSKPHPEPVLLACEILRIDPSRVLFVGDDVRDIEAGEAAGTMTAAATYGYGAHEFNERHTRDSLVVADPLHLRDYLEAGG